MDQSQQARSIRQVYGGSDSTRPSFNWPEYAQNTSITAPKDLGVLDGRRLIHDGFIGAEDGGQTLFFRFRLERRARVYLQLTSANAYTIQYISASVRNSDGDAIALPTSQQEIPDGIGTVATYAEPFYWEEGYAQLEIEPGISAVNQEQVPGNGVLTSTGPSQPASIEPGAYIVAISSSQWSRLPCHLEIVALGNTPLSAVCDITAGLTARTNLPGLSALVDTGIGAQASATRQANLVAAVDFSVEPIAGVTRISTTR
jgi:hypothetical protein